MAWFPGLVTLRTGPPDRGHKWGGGCRLLVLCQDHRRPQEDWGGMIWRARGQGYTGYRGA